LSFSATNSRQNEIPAKGYFAPVRGTRGFETHCGRRSRISNKPVRPNVRKARAIERTLGACRRYAPYRRWLADTIFVTIRPFTSTPHATVPPMFLYGFYDLTAVTKQFVADSLPHGLFFHGQTTTLTRARWLNWFKLSVHATGDYTHARRCTLTVVSAR